MTVYPSPRFQAERTIAAARVLLAAGSLFALWMDPGGLTQVLDFKRRCHELGVLCCTPPGLAVITWRRSGVPGSPLATHITDLLIFSGFQYLTPGSSSPFFIFFLFSTFCGALRWGWRGTLITASFVMVAYLSAAVVRPGGSAEFDLNRFVTRIVYLVVSAGFLAYLGLYEERLRGELDRLAHWPVVAASGTAQGTRQILEYGSADPERGTRRRDLGSGGGADQHAGRVVGRWIHDFDARARRPDAAPAAGSRAGHVPVRHVAQ